MTKDNHSPQTRKARGEMLKQVIRLRSSKNIFIVIHVLRAETGLFEREKPILMKSEWILMLQFAKIHYLCRQI